MKTPVVALGLDAADPVLLERYMAAGHLPVLSGLRDNGTYARLTTFDYCRAEASNTTFLTGCVPPTHGYWSPFRFQPTTASRRRRTSSPTTRRSMAWAPTTASPSSTCRSRSSRRGQRCPGARLGRALAAVPEPLESAGTVRRDPRAPRRAPDAA